MDLNRRDDDDDIAPATPKVPLQTSANWERFSATVGQIRGDDIYREPFPRFIYAHNRAIIFTVIDARTGERIPAYVDDSQQASAEGRQWREVATNKIVYKYAVAAWREQEPKS